MIGDINEILFIKAGNLRRLPQLRPCVLRKVMAYRLFRARGFPGRTHQSTDVEFQDLDVFLEITNFVVAKEKSNSQAR